MFIYIYIASGDIFFFLLKIESPAGRNVATSYRAVHKSNIERSACRWHAGRGAQAQRGTMKRTWPALSWPRPSQAKESNQNPLEVYVADRQKGKKITAHKDPSATRRTATVVVHVHSSGLYSQRIQRPGKKSTNIRDGDDRWEKGGRKRNGKGRR